MTRGDRSTPEGDRDLIFICYSRADNQNPDFRGLLEKHIQAVNLAQGGRLKLRFFADTQIKPGVRWLEEIRTALARTRVAAILEGPGLMASDFVQTVELRRLPERGTGPCGGDDLPHPRPAREPIPGPGRAESFPGGVAAQPTAGGPDRPATGRRDGDDRRQARGSLHISNMTNL